MWNMPPEDLKPILSCQRGQSRIALRPADKDDVVRAQFFIAHFEILADGNRAFERSEEMLLQLLGGIAVGARVGHGAVYQNRGTQTLADIGRHVHWALLPAAPSIS